ncbi:DNA polymerase III subunit delta [Granulicatella sp. zg-ZJ]|uniref:DNA polymerase III subunit delta n=1 Tax=Granulicatella sp. zg-ZJ TaxID=2678504 RepID=UPI0013D5759A|nr:DNA polymerase III subunit delta [Granulicatella sp. zg-ZJ]NEW62890.1 DNA polymerase III subunit delta [Granulicatella sp. zg-ZJ]
MIQYQQYGRVGEKVQKVLSKIRKGQLEPVYFVQGTETYLMNLVKQTFLNDVLTQEERELNISIYNAQDTSLEYVVEDALSMPFFGEKKVILLEQPTFLLQEKTKSVTDGALETFLTYLEEPNQDTILVVLAPFDTVDNRKKVVKQLKKVAEYIDVNPLSEKETSHFIQDVILAEGYAIDKQVLTLLLERVDYQLSLAMNEVDKLFLATMDTKKITKDSVLSLVPKHLESNVFTLVEAVLKKNVEQALLIYRELILQKEEPIKLLALLLGQFRLLMQVTILEKKGYQQQDIIKQLKQHPYRVQLAMKQSNAYHLKDMIVYYQILSETDYALKTNTTDKHLLLELALLKTMIQESENETENFTKTITRSF